jgi:homoserine kinase
VGRSANARPTTIAPGSVAEVSVPASSANLGPGFDSLGLALAVRDRVRVEITTGSGTSVAVAGEGAGMLPTDDQNLVAATIRTVFEDLGFRQPGLSIRSDNAVPHGKGLGSSAVALTCGVAAALLLVDLTRGGTGALDRSDLLDRAGAMEGHPDNVAACVYGGLTVAWTEGGHSRAVRLAVPSLRPVIALPATGFATTEARALLPATIGHAAAAANAGRAALLVAVLSGQADPALLLAATVDALHQPFRAPSMPASAALIATLRGHGIAAVLSGAGPSVLVLATAAQREQAMRLVSSAGGCLPLEVDGQGTCVLAAVRSETGSSR